VKLQTFRHMFIMSTGTKRQSRLTDTILITELTIIANLFAVFVFHGHTGQCFVESISTTEEVITSTKR
jgi:hypothetical protein